MAVREGELGRSWVGAKEGNRCVMQQQKSSSLDPATLQPCISTSTFYFIGMSETSEILFYLVFRHFKTDALDGGRDVGHVSPPI
jgi:hypothetical protein